MKLIITAVNSDGRSYVRSNEAFSGETGIFWTYAPEDIRASIANIRAEDAAVEVEPPPEGCNWIYVEFPPGPDDHGFHITRTVDFIFVVEGELQMLLDEDTVDLHAGDFVVQQAARHAWRNPTETPTRIFALVHRPA